MKRRTQRRKSRKRSRVSGNQSLLPAIVSGTRRGKKGKRSRRRSKVSGMGDTTNTLMGVAAGVLAGIILDKAVEKFAPNLNPKIKSAGKVIVGGFLVAKGGKPMLKNVGLGLAANGVSGAARDFGVISKVDEFMNGIGAGEDTMLIEMNGTPENAGRMMSGDDSVSGSNMVMPSVIGE